MQEFITFITPVLQDLMYVVLISVVTILSKHLIAFIQSKREAIKEKTKQDIFDSTLDDALRNIQKIVDTVSQTYVNTLKKNGSFTDEAQEKAFNTALEDAKKLINDSSKEILVAAYGDFDAWLRIQIESYILSKKEEKEEKK